MNEIKTKTPLMAETTKKGFVYARIEKDLVAKIDELMTKKDLKNRSQAIRCLIFWSLENGLEKMMTPEKRIRRKKVEGESPLDEVIYTRIENNLLSKIDQLRSVCEIKNRSETVRGIITWAFDNGVENY